MNTLDKVVQKFVENGFQEEHINNDLINNDPEFSVESMKTAMKENIKERIIAEIIENKKNEIDAYSKKSIEEERKKSTLIAIKELLWEAFVVAIFVCLLGNELTTLIEFFKSFGGEQRHTLITVILIIVYASIVLAMYVIKFTKDIIRTFVNKSK